MVAELTAHKLRQLSRRKLYYYQGYIDCGIDRMVRDERWEKAVALQSAIVAEFERRNTRPQRWLPVAAAIATLVIAVAAVVQCRANKHPATQEHSGASIVLSTPQQSPASQSTTPPGKLDVLPTPQTEFSQLLPTPTLTPMKWPPPAP